MPKRFGFLMEKIASVENLQHAIVSFVKTRESSFARKKLSWLLNEQEQTTLINRLREELLSGRWKAKPPSRFKRIDSLSKKEREICAFGIEENIVQTAIVFVAEPILYRGAYENSCCNIKGKGIARIEKYIKKFAKKDDRKRRLTEAKGKVYRSPVANFAKFDIRKFYDSIDHPHLRRLLCRRIKDVAAVDLIMQFAEVNGVRGLCIGGRVSHLLANFYLEDVDRKILNSGACARYARYMDDCVVWGSSKAKLHELIRSLMDEIYLFGLGIKPGWFVTPWKSRAVDFCGYLFFRDGGTGIRKRIKLRIIRRLRAVAKGVLDLRLLNSLASYIGYIERGSRGHLCKRYLNANSILKLKQLMRTKRKDCYDRYNSATV